MYTWDLRWDLYKELGYPEIKTLDDMVDAFRSDERDLPDR